MISLNDVLLAMSNIPVNDPIAEIWGRGLQGGGYTVIEYTGTLPITADGNALLDYKIYGNTVQDGTPSPDMPVDVVGCGTRTENLFDETYPNIRLDMPEYRSIFVGDGEFTLSTMAEQYGLSANLFFLTGRVNSGAATATNGVWKENPRTITSLNGYVTIAYRYYDDEKSDPRFNTAMLNLGSEALPYEPYGYKLPMVSRTENLFDISKITECSVGTISRYGIEYTDIGYYTITAFGALNGWCYIRVLNGDNIVSTAYLIVPNQLTPIKINLSVGQRFVIYNANPDNVEATTSLFNQWKPVVLYSNSSQPEYPSSYIPYDCKSSPIYLGEAETTRRIKKLVLTGEEGWSRSTNERCYYINLSNGCPADYLKSKVVTVMCSHYEGQINTNSGSNEVNDGCICFFTGGGFELYIGERTIATAADFKSYLAAQYAAGTPVTVWYVLAESETGIVNEPLMKIGDHADTVSMEQAGVSIPTIAGTTVIDYDGAPKPSEMYIKYRR